MTRNATQRIAQFYSLDIAQAEAALYYRSLLKSELEKFFATAIIVKRYKPRGGLVSDITDAASSLADAMPFSPLITRPIAAVAKFVDQHFQEKDLLVGLEFISKIGRDAIDLFIQKVCNQFFEARVNDFKIFSSEEKTLKQVDLDFKAVVASVKSANKDMGIYHASSLTILPESALSPDAHLRDKDRNVDFVVRQIMQTVVDKDYPATPTQRIKASILSTGESFVGNAKRILKGEELAAKKQRRFFTSKFQNEALLQVASSPLGRKQRIAKSLSSQGLPSPTKPLLTAYNLEKTETEDKTKHAFLAVEEIANSIKKSSKTEEEIEIEKILKRISEIKAFALLHDRQALFDQATELEKLVEKAEELEEIRADLSHSDEGIRKVLFTDELEETPLLTADLEEKSSEYILELLSSGLSEQEDSGLDYVSLASSDEEAQQDWWRKELRKIADQSCPDHQIFLRLLGCLKDFTKSVSKNDTKLDVIIERINKSECYIGEEWIAQLRKSRSAIEEKKVEEFKEGDLCQKIIYLMVFGDYLSEVSSFQEAKSLALETLPSRSPSTKRNSLDFSKVTNQQTSEKKSLVL